MESLINKFKMILMNKIQNIRITPFSYSLVVTGKGVIKNIRAYLSISENDYLIIIVDDGIPLTLHINEVSMIYGNTYVYTLNEAISFDKKFEIKCNYNKIVGSVTYITE